jgi:D-glycero-beta-D-manno-heptose-7-phosphate kinase
MQIDPQRLTTIINAIKNSSIMVIGDVMLDEYMWGDVRRISPEAPVPVVEVESVTRRLGGAANVVQNLARLGAHPLLVSVCGSDTTGENLRSILGGISCTDDTLIASKSRPTTIKTRIMARHQQIVRADREVNHDLDNVDSEALWNAFSKSFEKSRGVIVSDYGKGVISQPLIGRIIEHCTKAGKFIAIDPKERHFELYRGVSVVTPNLKEAHAMIGLPYRTCSDDDIRDLGWKILEQLDLQYLLITLSERGMALFDGKGHVLTHLPTVARKVFDVTGAGDTVISVYAAACVSGATPIEAAYLANHAAGLTVAELGTASVDPETLLADCRVVLA